MEYRLKCAVTNALLFSAHAHKYHEILHFTKGSGEFWIENKRYTFRPGTIIVVPPHTEHRSAAAEEVERIFLQGDFESVFPSGIHIVLQDENGEGSQLARLLLRNRFGDVNYSNALCDAYLQSIAHHLHLEDSVHKAVQQIIRTITDHFCDAQCNVTDLLREHGYAEDYLRSQFKRITGKTPHAFLTEARIQHACFLIEVYHKTVPLVQISEQCGYTDYIHFSKTFKALVGVSPREFLNNSDR